MDIGDTQFSDTPASREWVDWVELMDNIDVVRKNTCFMG